MAYRLPKLLITRRGVFNEPRNIAVYLLRQVRGESLNNISELFNIKAYSTVSSILRRVSRLKKSDRKIKKQVTAIAPGVLFPSPGGLTFDEITDLVQQISRKGRIAGVSLFEVRPERDVNGLTASTAVQLIVNFIGTIIRNDQTEE